MSLTVVNRAIAGRSARSYTDEGRFTTLINTVKSGDFVVIEFGHNDGQSGSVDNGRQDAFGESIVFLYQKLNRPPQVTVTTQRRQ